MKKKRRFSGGVRRVRSITNKPAFEFASKRGSIIQAESIVEWTWLLRCDRDAKIEQYLSQPPLILYEGRMGAKEKYKPDYKVIKGKQ